MSGKTNITDMSFENTIEITEVLLAHKCTYRSGELCTMYSKGRYFSGFVCPLSGTAIYRPQNGEIFTVTPGEIVYLPEMSRYTVEGGENGFIHYTVNFRLSCGSSSNIQTCFASLFGDIPVKISTDKYDEFRAHFAKAVSGFDTNMPGAILLVKAKILEIMYMFFAGILRKNSAVDEYETLSFVKEYIEAHYNESIRAEELSRMCSMSETSLRRKFREYTGQPPLDYQIGLRMRRAKELLLERTHNVSEVARLVGFDDVNYFSRLFKKRIGVSPQIYEKMY